MKKVTAINIPTEVNPPITEPVVVEHPLIKNKKLPLLLLTLLLIALPISIWAVNQITPRPPKAASPLLASVRINPGQIIADLGANTVYLSALAYDVGGSPIFSDISYQWGISTTNSIGSFVTNGTSNLASFTPSATVIGRGDIWVKAFDTTGLKVMKSIPVYVGIVPTISPVTTPTPTATLGSNITILQPNGGESLSPNQTYTIMWTSTNVDQIAIDLIDSNEAFSTIALPMTASIGQYNWTITPTWYGTSHQFKIKVYSYPSKSVFDLSDNYFTISFPNPTPTKTPTPTPTRIPPTPTPIQKITITAPNSADPLIVNQSYQIQWTASNVSNISAIRLSCYDNANLYLGMHTITSNIPNTNSYPWVVSTYGACSGRAIKYKIGVESSYTNDMSDNYFTIISPTPSPTNTPTPLPTNTPTPTVIPPNTPTPTPTISIPTPTPTPTAPPRRCLIKLPWPPYRCIFYAR